MKNYGRTYWFTWGFLILAASFTGVASVKGAFFGGMVAAIGGFNTIFHNARDG